MGVNHSVQGTETVTLLNTLACSPATSAGPAPSPFSITGQCNAMGTREAGFTASMPGYRAYDDPAARARAGRPVGHRPRRRLPTARGRAYPDIIDGVMTATIKGLWIIATNPPVSFPNREVLERRPGRLDLLVVQDGFETPDHRAGRRRAARRHLGREGRHLHQQRAPGVPGPGGGRAARRGPQPTSTSSSPSPSAGGAATSCSPGGPAPMTPSTSGAGCRPAARATTAASPGSASTRPAACSGRAPPATTCRSAAPPASTPTAASTAPAAGRLCVPSSPSRSATPPPTRVPVAAQHRPHRRALAHPHQDRPGRRSSRRLAPEAWVEVNPPTPTRLGVRAGDRVRVGSSRGEVDRHPGPGHRHRSGAGEVFMPFHWDERCANRLTDDQFDPISPRAQLQAVRGEGRGAADPSGSVTSLRVRRRGDGRRHPRRRARR